MLYNPRLPFLTELGLMQLKKTSCQNLPLYKVILRGVQSGCKKLCTFAITYISTCCCPELSNFQVEGEGGEKRKIKEKSNYSITRAGAGICSVPSVSGNLVMSMSIIL